MNMLQKTMLMNKSFPYLNHFQKDGNVGLSFNQKSLINRMNSNDYNPIVMSAFSIEGSLDYDAIEESVLAIARQNEVFRLKFDFQHQEISEDYRVEISKSIPFGYQGNHQIFFIQRVVEMDISKPSLVKIYIEKQSENETILIILVHHLIFDGYSLKLFYENMSKYYNEILLGNHCRNEYIEKLDYTDFVLWQHELCEGKYFDEHIQYFAKRYECLIQSDSFCRDVSVCEVSIDTEKIVSLCKIFGSSRFILLLSFYIATLAFTYDLDYTNVWIPVAARNRKQLLDIYGYISNDLLICWDNKGKEIHPSLCSIINEIREALVYQDAPSSMLAEQYHIELCSHQMFYFAQILSGEVNLFEKKAHPIDIIKSVDNYDISCYYIEQKHCLRVYYNNNKRLATNIDKFLFYFKQYLEGGVKNW